MDIKETCKMRYVRLIFVEDEAKKCIQKRQFQDS